MGEGVLVEFSSAVSAVECAAELQRAMIAANGDLPVDQRIVLRVGVNLGDVMVDGSDLYGDGVNVAARIRSEEHKSELQALMSSSYAVFCVKKTNEKINYRHTKQTTI